MKYTHFGAGFGIRFEHELYDKYLKEIGELTLIDSFNEETEKDVIETLQKSLNNKKSFYENAKPYIKKSMEDYERMIENPNILF